MYKKGKVNTTFRKRFFVINTDCKLLYFRSPESPMPSGMINIGKAMSITYKPLDLGKKCIFIEVEGRTHVLYMDGETETKMLYDMMIELKKTGTL